MKPNNTLTIGEIIEKTDEKSKIFADIHHHIVIASSAGKGDEVFNEIKSFFESFTASDFYQNTKISTAKKGLLHSLNCLYCDSYKKAFLFLYGADCTPVPIDNTQNEVKGGTETALNERFIELVSSLPQSDLYLLNEAYKSIKPIEFKARLRFGQRYHNVLLPHEIKENKSKESTDRVNLRHNKNIPKKSLVIDAWLKGNTQERRGWSSYSECAKNICDRPDINMTYRTVCKWLSDYLIINKK